MPYNVDVQNHRS